MKTDLEFWISYFYNLRFLPADIIPVSTALSDPFWYRPKNGEPWLDSRGVLNGLNFSEFHHPKAYACGCPCTFKNPGECEFLRTYRLHLDTLQADIEIPKFESLAEYLRSCGIPVRGFCLMVYETPDNPCSERQPLKELWDVWGLELPEFNPSTP